MYLLKEVFNNLVLIFAVMYFLSLKKDSDCSLIIFSIFLWLSSLQTNSLLFKEINKRLINLELKFVWSALTW
jgi:hypothetical protein